MSRLSDIVITYLDTELESLRVEGKVDPSPTSGFQRVVQRAILHVQSSGKDVVTGANVLVALFSERESYAVYFLQQQDMSRLDAVSYLSHGVGKGGKPAATTVEMGNPGHSPVDIPLGRCRGQKVRIDVAELWKVFEDYPAFFALSEIEVLVVLDHVLAVLEAAHENDGPSQ